MSYIKVFTNILRDTKTHINIQKSIYWKNPKTVCVIKKKIRKMVSWTQVLEDIYCSGKKGRKQRRAELGIVKDLPGFRRESTEERKPEDHFRKNTTLRFSWEFMTDQPGCISARCPTWIVRSALKGRTVALVKRDLKWKKLGWALDRVKAEGPVGTAAAHRGGADSWQTAASHTAAARQAGAVLSRSFK